MNDATGQVASSGRWPIWKIAVVIYPLAAGAVAVNIFFVGLMIQALALPALSPLTSILGGIVLGVPFAWITARWLSGLVGKAEKGSVRGN